ncbi:integrase, catalytic region, zinc finger, CCHC-type containing protein, partial [Tanacetum coccineum]
EDIQCASFDTRPPMLDRTDFASWQHGIRLYCRGIENGVNILKSIEEGPFQMGTIRDPIAEGTKRCPATRYADLIEVRGTKHGVQVASGMGHLSTEYGKLQISSQARQIKCYNCNGIGHIARNYTQPKRPQNSEYFKDKMLLMQAQENRVALDEKRYCLLQVDKTMLLMKMDEQTNLDLVLNVDNGFTADDMLGPLFYFDSDVEEGSYCLDYVHRKNLHPHILNNVVDKSLTAELATYKEQVELYERRAKFELTEREQKIDEQLRIVITDRNIKEENLKRELHSLKLKLTSTINHNKSMVEEVTSFKKDFKQKENKYLEEFLDMKALKEKVGDKLYKQDQSLQTARTKEVKEMKEIFEELEAEVDQNVVNRKYDEIERNNILIANDNLIDDCLSKDVFYIATNSELTVSRFTEMHDAHTVVQARCLELEAELSKLQDKVQKDDHTELVKLFSNLEVNQLNLQLKYQNLKERFGNNTSPPARDAPDFDSDFGIKKK